MDSNFFRQKIIVPKLYLKREFDTEDQVLSIFGVIIMYICLCCQAQFQLAVQCNFHWELCLKISVIPPHLHKYIWATSRPPKLYSTKKKVKRADVIFERSLMLYDVFAYEDMTYYVMTCDVMTYEIMTYDIVCHDISN